MMITRHNIVPLVLVLLLAPQAGGFASHARGRLPTLPSLETRFSPCCPVAQNSAPILHAPKDSWDTQRDFQLAAVSSNENSDNDDIEPKVTTQRGARLRKWKRRFRRWMVTVAIGSSFFRAVPANAKYSHELRETPTSSLRPGITLEEAQQIEEGELDGRSIEAKSALTTSQPEKPTTTAKATAPQKQQAKQSLYYGDDFDDDDGDDDFLEEEIMGTAASKADQTAAKRLQSRSNFAAYHQGKSSALTIKVAVAFFVPTYGSLIVREYFRRRREESYVQKGLEILEAQKAEYFNVTGTAADSDVEDALKNLKKNETKTGADDDDDDDEDTDDDDNDDDDDDDEDDTPRGRKGGPRKPPGGDGGNDDGGSSGSSGDGSGRPSEEDLDKLNQMFKRS